VTSLPRVLCVDDEPMLLAALKTSLHRRYDVTTAEGGLEALHLLRERGPFTVVISDFRMPGMDGARFLARARDVAPDTVRILLTGQAGLEDAIEVVNQGYIFRFLTKPCPPQVLLAAIENAVDQARLATGSSSSASSKRCRVSCSTLSGWLRSERSPARWATN